MTSSLFPQPAVNISSLTGEAGISLPFVPHGMLVPLIQFRELTSKQFFRVTVVLKPRPAKRLTHRQPQIKSFPLDVAISGALNDDFGRVQDGTCGALGYGGIGLCGVTSEEGGGADGAEDVGGALHCRLFLG